MWRFLQETRYILDVDCLVPESVEHRSATSQGQSSSAPVIEVRPLKDNEGNRSNIGTELASMDSTDTFASCATHPFPSQADLTAEQSHDHPSISYSSTTTQKDSNLYVNPLDDPRLSPAISSANHPSCPGSPTPRNSPRQRALRPQAYTTDSFDDTRSTDILLGGSRSSLQDSPLPKHRRARFQEVRETAFKVLLRQFVVPLSITCVVTSVVS